MSVDRHRPESHTGDMPGAERVVHIADPRNRGRYLRASWHPSRRLVIISQWRDGICVASTPIEIGEIGALVDLFVAALRDALTGPTAVREATFASLRGDLREVVRRWVRPRAATVIALAPKRLRGSFDSADTFDTTIHRSAANDA